MKNKIKAICYKIGMHALPLCAMAVAIANINSTGSWLNGQPEVPQSLKKYRKF